MGAFDVRGEGAGDNGMDATMIEHIILNDDMRVWDAGLCAIGVIELNPVYIAAMDDPFIGFSGESIILIWTS